MKFLFGALLLAMYTSVSAAVVPSPAGGGYFQIYAPGDYAYVADHEDFDANMAEGTSFTIEMWIYQKREMRPFDRMRIKPDERWFLIAKTGSYRMQFSHDNIASHDVSFSIENSVLGGTHNDVEAPLNQWHYVAFMAEAQYRQEIIDKHLWGAALTGRTKFRGVLDTTTSLRIGGGVTPLLGLPGGPFEGKPLWTAFTGGLIDEVRISNIIRYPREKLDERFWRDTIVVPTGSFKSDEHTVALWHFDFDGSPGSKWRDASGNGHHLTYHGDYLSVEPTQKLSVLWGELKRQ